MTATEWKRQKMGAALEFVAEVDGRHAKITRPIGNIDAPYVAELWDDGGGHLTLGDFENLGHAIAIHNARLPARPLRRRE